LSQESPANTHDFRADLSLGDRTVRLRRAAASDVDPIVALLADDPLGRSREAWTRDGDLAPYLAAFALIDADPHQLLLVAELDGEVVGTMQLTFIPGLSRNGSMRMLVEAVRIAASERGHGLGASMMRWAIEHARARGCAVVQLTSDKSRRDAHRFYDRLGFVASHEGYKLAL
jgi:GNAT superfamily N-acetyltransferase